MKKLFTNDKFFLITVLMTVIGTIAYEFYCLSFFPQYSYIAVLVLVNAVSTVALYVSYKNYSKNAMKGLIGFLLMGLLALTITTVFPIEPEQQLYTVFSLINVLVVVLLCVNHFVINSEHHSKSINIRLNQVLLVIMFVLYLVMGVIWVKTTTGIINLVYMMGIPVAAFGITAAVVCVESRLDAYRIDREEAGWTEEKGYPEGYVHEYQKNQK